MDAAEVIYTMLVSSTSLNDRAPIPAISSLHLEVGSAIDKVCTCGYWTDYGTNPTNLPLVSGFKPLWARACVHLNSAHPWSNYAAAISIRYYDTSQYTKWYRSLYRREN